MMPQKIEELFAWVATETDGSDGIMAAPMPIQGQMMLVPLVGADRVRVECYRATAEAIRRRRLSDGDRVLVRLMRFSTAAVLEELA